MYRHQETGNAVVSSGLSGFGDDAQHAKHLGQRCWVQESAHTGDSVHAENRGQ
jgi:hypothetical protein